MEAAAIHRVIEQHAASRGDIAAIVDGRRIVSYRELNARANGLARILQSHGLRREGAALVGMPRTADLAIVVVAVLKAGASCAWLDPARASHAALPGVSIAVSRNQSPDDHGACYRAVDVARPLSTPFQVVPNLPILTRGSDTACVLCDATGSAVLVPHATITALRVHGIAPGRTWGPRDSVLDLLLALTAGVSLTISDQPTVSAAA